MVVEDKPPCGDMIINPEITAFEPEVEEDPWRAVLRDAYANDKVIKRVQPVNILIDSERLRIPAAKPRTNLKRTMSLPTLYETPDLMDFDDTQSLSGYRWKPRKIERKPTLAELCKQPSLTSIAEESELKVRVAQLLGKQIRTKSPGVGLLLDDPGKLPAPLPEGSELPEGLEQLEGCEEAPEGCEDEGERSCTHRTTFIIHQAVSQAELA